MADTLKTFLIALVTAVVVQAVLGPVLLRLQGYLPSVAPTQLVAPVGAPPAATAPAPAPATAPSAPAPALTAPNVEGMTVAEARDRFRDRGLVIIEDGAREVAEAAPGTIVQQRPAPGAALTDLELRVIVAVAPPGILVPDVVGLPLAQAQARLEKEGLTVAEPGSEASSQPPGSILKQIPAAGTRTAGGTQVYLVQSQAPAIAVPKVTGRSLRAAKDAITKAGLTVGSTRYEEDAELGGGTVLRQSPAPGEEVPSGTAVDLVAVSPN